MQTLIYVSLGLIVVAQVIYMFISKKKKTNFINKVSESVLNQDFEVFDQLIVSKEAGRYLSSFNREFLKLNVAILQEKDKKVSTQLSILMRMNLNDVQRQEVLLKSFVYFTEKENEKRSTKLKTKLLELNLSDELKRRIERMYSVYIEKSDRYLKELEIETQEGKNKFINEVLIQKIKENCRG